MHGVCLVNQMSIEPGVLKPVCLEIGPREHPTSLCFILRIFFYLIVNVAYEVSPFLIGMAKR